MKKTKYLLMGGTVLSLGMVAPSSVFAQIDEIVVTATKRETAIQSTAIAMNAFQGEELAFKALNNVQDLQFQVPSLIYGEVLGNPQISIRGVGLPLTTGDAEQGVASHIDGVYLSRPTLSNVALGDLERVEVLRGPQGTLYGRSSTGGTINYISKKPTEDLTAGASVGVGSYGTFKGNGFVSGPVIEDQLLFRIYGTAKADNGYTDNLFDGADDLNERDEFGGRVAVRAMPTDGLTIDVQGLYYEDEGSYANAEATRTIIDNGPGITPQPGQFDPAPFSEIHDFQDTADRSTFGVTATAEWIVNDITLRSITGYYDHVRNLNHDFDHAAGTGFDGLSVARRDRSDTITQEINLSGGSFSDRIDWILGGFYLHDESRAKSFADPVGGAFFDYARTQTINSYALFGDVTLSITDSLRLVGGARASWEDQEGRSFATAGGFTNPACVGGGVYEEEFNQVTPKGGIEIDATDNVLLYGQYQKGHKPGGLNVNNCLNTYDEEIIDAFEGGIKAQLFGDRLTVNAAGFHYDYENLQTFIVSNFAAIVENAPKAKITGAEIELTANLNDMFSVDGGATWLDGEYDEFSSEDQFLFGPGAPTEDLSGNKLTRAPEWSAVMGVNLEVPTPIDFFGNVQLRGEVVYSSSYFLRRFNREFDRQAAYALGNIYASIGLGEKSQLRAFVKNVTETEYVITLFDNTSNGQINSQFGRPREWGLEISTGF